MKIGITPQTPARRIGLVRSVASAVAVIVVILVAALLASSAVAAAEPQRGGLGDEDIEFDETVTSEGGTLRGCSGSVTSFDPDGTVADTASGESPNKVTDLIDGGPAFTKTNPFRVSTAGKVDYKGSSDGVITDAKWKLTINGVRIDEGGSANDEQAIDDEGTIELADLFPFKVTGLVFVEGELTGTGSGCQGSGWVSLVGSPTFTVPWVLGIVLIAVGGFVLLFARPTHSWKAT